LSSADDTEKEVIRRMAAACVRLRFDRVANRLLNEVKAAVAQTLTVDRTIAFTVTAPIRLPATTTIAVQQWLERLKPELSSTLIHINEIHARMTRDTTSDVRESSGSYITRLATLSSFWISRR
jgi:hypothetical protein